MTVLTIKIRACCSCEKHNLKAGSPNSRFLFLVGQYVFEERREGVEGRETPTVALQKRR